MLPKKSLPNRSLQPWAVPASSHTCWPVNFLHDSLFPSRCSGPSMSSITSTGKRWSSRLTPRCWRHESSCVLDTLAASRGYSQRLRVDNGPELVSTKLDEWARTRVVLLDHIQPGKPAHNAYIERFNRTIGRRCFMCICSTPGRSQSHHRNVTGRAQCQPAARLAGRFAALLACSRGRPSIAES